MWEKTMYYHKYETLVNYSWQPNNMIEYVWYEVFCEKENVYKEKFMVIAVLVIVIAIDNTLLF